MLTGTPNLSSPRSTHSLHKLMQMKSTGSLLVPSPELRTKVAVDHAGLSLPLVDSKELITTPLETLRASLNNNLLIALTVETRAAMVALWKSPSNISRPPMLFLKKTTPILLEQHKKLVLASMLIKTTPKLKSLTMPESLQIHLNNLRLQLPRDLSLLPLRLISLFSNTIPLVLSLVLLDLHHYLAHHM